MTDRPICPDCGRDNDPGAEECAHCGFPLTAKTPATAPAAAPTPTAPATPAPIEVQRPLPRRPRPRAQRADSMSLSLWLVFGTIAALVVVWVAVKSNFDRAKTPVEGASPVQQASADSLMMAVQRDSTDIDARNRLADVLYDTSNWSDAIVQYRAVVRMDSSRVPAMVDMGVCYFNLSDSQTAEKLFLLALQREPHQPIAQFNLGILYESRQDWRTAIRYFHGALQSDPPASMQATLQQHLMNAMKQVDAKAPPLGETK